MGLYGFWEGMPSSAEDVRDFKQGHAPTLPSVHPQAMGWLHMRQVRQTGAGETDVADPR